MGGGASSAGHLTIGTGTVVLAWGGVTKNVARGAMVAGHPAQDVRSWRREVAMLRRMNKGDQRGHEI